MRCQQMDDDLQCRLDATRRVMVASGDPPDLDQAGFSGTIYMVQVCKEHDPDPGGRCRCRALARQRPSANVPGGDAPVARQKGPYQFTKCATRSACRISR
jgi:hypothetical protein